MYELVRQIWEEGRITEEWKETVIVPIYKRGSGDRCENYRGIALRNAAYKMLSNVILGKDLQEVGGGCGGLDGVGSG